MDARTVVQRVPSGRGSLATRSLQKIGYTNVANMRDIMNTWREKGYEAE